MKVAREKVMLGQQLQEYIGRSEFGNIIKQPLCSRHASGTSYAWSLTERSKKFGEDFMQRGRTKMGMNRNASIGLCSLE